MNGNVALKKDVLPAHAWQGASGKRNMRVVKAPVPRAELDSLPAWKRNEEIGKLVMAAVADMKVKPLSRAEIDAWTSRLLDENRGRDNHSC